jgi:hypothetical protein
MPRRSSRALSASPGPLFDFEEAARGVRLWKGPNGNFLALEIDPQVGAQLDETAGEVAQPLSVPRDTE